MFYGTKCNQLERIMEPEFQFYKFDAQKKVRQLVARLARRSI